MIVPMKKLSLLVFYKDYQAFLEELRERGVVHIHENRKRSAEDEALKQKLAIMKRIGEMIRRLERRLSVPDEEAETVFRDWAETVMPAEKLAVYYRMFQLPALDDGDTEVTETDILVFLENQYKRIEQIKQQIAALGKEQEVYEPWGDFPHEHIEHLRNAGWDLRFFVAPDRKYLPDWEEKYNAFVINAEKGQKYFMTVTPSGERPAVEADAVIFPEMSREEIDSRQKALETEKLDVERNLDKVSLVSVRQLREFRVRLLEDTDVMKVNGASSVLLDERVIALEGWVPEAIAADTDAWLKGKEVFYEMSAPAMEDNPPVLLKNNQFARLFEFIGELYSLPNYREIDMTPFFAPFFVLFFGFCLGDAGYGLLLLIGISLYKIKAKPSIRPILSLAQWLGAATVVMGIVSGTFFGIQLVDVQIPWVVKFRALMLNSQQLFNLALAIGAVQIIFGMFLKVANLWKQFGFTAALSTIGWLIMILGEGICYLLSQKGWDMKVPMYTVAGVAGLLIFVFNNVRRNVFINVGAGLWDSYNMLTGLLGDTLSYIRLFALGISSSVLGLVFNDLAVNMSGDIPVVKQVLMLVILVFGHSVNLFMAGLGSFVHPMRLTFVEFYKNAGFEGGGKKYQPFKKRMAPKMEEEAETA